MIGRLQGKILEKHPPELLVDVNGVGYELRASMNTFYKLPEVGETIILYTHFVVREDAQTLFGFVEYRERILFRALIKINGVGPKMAITILSSIDPEGFVRCVANEDVASLVRLPGVGKKTAERLIIEMRDRLNDISRYLKPKTSEVPSEKSSDVVQDAISALISLGYRAQEASRAVTKIAQDDLSSEELIRLALQSVA